MTLYTMKSILVVHYGDIYGKVTLAFVVNAYLSATFKRAKANYFFLLFLIHRQVAEWKMR